MVNAMRLILILTLIISFGFVAVSAQNSPKVLEQPVEKTEKTEKQNKFAPVREPLKNPLPFQNNEQLTYELKLSRFPIYGTIGELTFVVNEDTPNLVNNNKESKPENTEKPLAENKENTNAESLAINKSTDKIPTQWKFSVEARSKGILTTIFRIKVDDLFTSFVNKNDFNVTKTVKIIDEGKKHREMVADFDTAKQKVKWIDTDLKTKKVVRSKENPSLNWVTDIVNGWYVMRAQPLTIGKTFSFPLADEGETYEIEVDALEKESLETDFGKFSTVKLEMKIFNGKYIRRKGRLFLWVTDDSRHVPLRAQIKSSFGTVTATLTEMKNVKNL
jgi:hypothetical protein